MQKRTIFGAVLLLFMTAVLAGLWIKPATATDTQEPCVPADAWTEVIEHPAETHVVHHDAVTHEEYFFAKFTHTKTKSPDSKTFGDYGPWTKWTPETHTSWELSTTPLGAPAFHGEGKYEDGTKWYREWQAQWDGSTTRTIVDEEAYDETIVDKEAWTETIEHPAVTCEEPPPTPTCEDDATLPGCEEVTPPPVEPPGLCETTTCARDLDLVRSHTTHRCGQAEAIIHQEFIKGKWRLDHIEYLPFDARKCKKDTEIQEGM